MPDPWGLGSSTTPPEASCQPRRASSLGRAPLPVGDNAGRKESGYVLSRGQEASCRISSSEWARREPCSEGGSLAARDRYPRPSRRVASNPREESRTSAGAPCRSNGASTTCAQARQDRWPADRPAETDRQRSHRRRRRGNTPFTGDSAGGAETPMGSPRPTVWRCPWPPRPTSACRHVPIPRPTETTLPCARHSAA